VFFYQLYGKNKKHTGKIYGLEKKLHAKFLGLCFLLAAKVPQKTQNNKNEMLHAKFLG
jgi:hypothetical protein